MPFNKQTGIFVPHRSRYQGRLTTVSKGNHGLTITASEERQDQEEGKLFGFIVKSGSGWKHTWDNAFVLSQNAIYPMIHICPENREIGAISYLKESGNAAFRGFKILDFETGEHEFSKQFDLREAQEAIGEKPILSINLDAEYNF